MDRKTGNKVYYLINGPLLATDTKMLNYSSDGDVVGVAFDATDEKNPYVAYRTNERGRVVVRKAFPSFEIARQNAAIMYDDLRLVMEKVEQSIAKKKEKNNKNQKPLYLGIRTRNKSVARVNLVHGGNGKIIINKKDVSEDYGDEALISIVRNSLIRTNILGKVNVIVNIYGGDLDSQADAVSHGISRALYYYNHKQLHKALKRDEERKKYRHTVVAAKRISRFRKR